MQPQEFKKELTSNIEDYHKVLAQQGRDIYELYKKDPEAAGRLFLQSICLPRSIFIRYLESKSLNTSSVGGAILEWTIYHIINSMIDLESIKNVAVDNKYTLPFKWKKKGHPEVNIDIAVGERMSGSDRFKRLLYLVEVKTNFEDGFLMYFDQQRIIYHHRRKVQPDFRYHYLAFSNPLHNMPKNKLSAIRNKNQLWVFPILGSKMVDIDGGHIKQFEDQAAEFLKFIYEPILAFSKGWVWKGKGGRDEGYYPKVIYGKVDKTKECMSLAPFVENEKTCERVYGKPLAYGARTKGDGIIFELIDKSSKVVRDIEFINDISYTAGNNASPFEYVLYHCSTTSNGAYSNPMWVYYKNGETSEIKDLPVVVYKEGGKDMIFKKAKPYGG